MAWICSSCRNLIDNHLDACDQCGAARAPDAMSGVGEPAADPVPAADYRDLVMEGHLAAYALWQRIGSGIMALVSIVLIALSGTLLRDSGSFGRAASGIIVAGGVFLLLLSAGYYVLGHFLSRFNNVARIITGVLTAIGLAWNLFSSCAGAMMTRQGGGANLIAPVFSMGWGIAVLWLIFNNRAAEVCKPDYRDIVARTPELKPRMVQSPFFWLPLVFIGLGVLIGLVAAAALTTRSHF